LRGGGLGVVSLPAAKSKAGGRLIPMHSEPIKLGFLDYVAGIGRGRLFPGGVQSSRGGRRPHTFPERFPAYRRSRGVTRGQLAFHSFRKCFVCASLALAQRRPSAASDGGVDICSGTSQLRLR
jgi:hypothetical protein